MVLVDMASCKRIIYTLGTDRRTEEDFIEILNAYGIELLIDVRRFPTSKFQHFRREELERLLKANNMGYIFMGNELGGYRKGGYEAYTETQQFREAIDRLLRYAENKKAVIVCAERFPWKGHRRWIARELKRRGCRVVHIIDKGKVWVP